MIIKTPHFYSKVVIKETFKDNKTHWKSLKNKYKMIKITAVSQNTNGTVIVTKEWVI